MATFLQLVQALHSEVGAIGTAPTEVTGQVAENQRLVNWIVRADLRIQNKWINWKFLRSEFTTNNQTAQGIATLAKPLDLKTWDLETFKVLYPGGTYYDPVQAVEYEEIKKEILTTTEGAPDRVIIMPDNSLKFDPVPNAIYTINADYYKKPAMLTLKTDVSLIPEEYHYSAVLGRAMVYYANFENAPEIRTQGLELYEEGLNELENHQLPNKNYSRNRTGGGFEVIGGQFSDEGY